MADDRAAVHVVDGRRVDCEIVPRRVAVAIDRLKTAAVGVRAEDAVRRRSTVPVPVDPGAVDLELRKKLEPVSVRTVKSALLSARTWPVSLEGKPSSDKRKYTLLASTRIAFA